MMARLSKISATGTFSWGDEGPVASAQSRSGRDRPQRISVMRANKERLLRRLWRHSLWFASLGLLLVPILLLKGQDTPPNDGPQIAPYPSSPTAPASAPDPKPSGWRSHVPNPAPASPSKALPGTGPTNGWQCSDEDA